MCLTFVILTYYNIKHKHNKIIKMNTQSNDTNDTSNQISYKDVYQEQNNNLENIDLNSQDDNDNDNDNDNENQKPFLEFSNDPSDESDSSEESESSKNNKNNTIDTIDTINFDDTGTNFIYNIIRYFDDIYVSGRTHIENNYFNLASNEDFNLVYPNIYVGNYSVTTNLDLLKGLGITHIISVIPTFNPAFEDKFKYLYIQAYDDEYQDITKYFDITNEFIKSCLFEGGKVLIHCMVGRSRSISIFIAFLIMIIKGGFNQCIVKMDDDIDNCNYASNLIEYQKLIENNKRKPTTNSYIDSEQISRNIQEIPRLSKKEANFINYKKQKMINDIDNIMCDYNLLNKELHNFKKTTFVETEETEELFENMQSKFSSKIFSEILKYVKSHRGTAMPNNNFINQLCKILF